MDNDKNATYNALTEEELEKAAGGASNPHGLSNPKFQLEDAVCVVSGNHAGSVGKIAGYGYGSDYASYSSTPYYFYVCDVNNDDGTYLGRIREYYLEKRV